eukprot:scaffold578393_cov36-Prasinocladus_malaysianus.AAC.1
MQDALKQLDGSSRSAALNYVVASHPVSALGNFAELPADERAARPNNISNRLPLNENQQTAIKAAASHTITLLQ